MGLVRRRFGRGGRVLLERFNRNLTDLITSSNNNNTTTSNDANNNNNINDKNSPQLYSFNYFSKFKTYYPEECFDLNEKMTIDSEILTTQMPAVKPCSSSKSTSESNNDSIVPHHLKLPTPI